MTRKSIPIRLNVLSPRARSTECRVVGKLVEEELHVKASNPSLVGPTPRVFTRPDASS